VAIDKLYFSLRFAAPDSASADPRRTDAKNSHCFPSCEMLSLQKTPAAAATCLLFPGIYADARSAPSGATHYAYRVQAGPTPRNKAPSLARSPEARTLTFLRSAKAEHAVRSADTHGDRFRVDLDLVRAGYRAFGEVRKAVMAIQGQCAQLLAAWRPRPRRRLDEALLRHQHSQLCKMPLSVAMIEFVGIERLRALMICVVEPPVGEL